MTTQTKAVKKVTPRKTVAKKDNTIVSHLTKAVSKVKPPVKVQERKLYAPIFTTPTGSKLFNYTEAVLSLLGMNGIKRDKARLQDFKAFQGMAKALSYHGKLGRLENKGGYVRLTTDGLSFFAKRITDGKVLKDTVTNVIGALKDGKALVKHLNGDDNPLIKGMHFKAVNIAK